ncbi:MAG: hypothetical protein SV760_00795 [Halobacteria archaeon]|nr:hypothetical protein [Halobacteria archaeon]
METQTTDRTVREKIERAVREEPWKTQQAIADEVDTSRSYVSEVVDDDPDLAAIREAYRDGIEVDVDDGAFVLSLLADVFEEVDDDRLDAVSKRLLESREVDELERVRIELQPTSDTTTDD